MLTGMRMRIPFVLLIWILAGTGSLARTAKTNFPTGLIPLAEEIRQGPMPDVEWIRGMEDLKKIGRAPRALPSSCANTLYLPAVRSQLLSNCGAYAPSYYYKTYQEARENGWEHPDPNVNPEQVMSPGFTFPLTNRGENSGAGLYTVMEVICRYGIATWADMPESTTWWEYPADDIWAKALPYRGDRVIGFDLTTEDGLQAMKQHLADGDLGVFSVPVSSTFATYPNGDGVDNGVLYANGEIYDVHALTLIGYDDAKTYNDGTGIKSGAFLAVNSWGGWGVVEPSVGTAGFCWLSYDYMQTNRGIDTSVLAMVDRTNYVPREVARIEIFHAVRSDLSLDIGSGNRVGGASLLEAFPDKGGDYPYVGTITVDVTDFMADDPDVYHLVAVDWDSVKVGTIQSFEVEKADGRIMVCPDTPLTLMNSDVYSPSSTWLPSRLDVGVLERRDARFWEEEMQAPMFAWVDFDQDGDSDWVVFGGNGTNAYPGLYLNDGLGGFTKQDCVLPALNSTRLAWGDYNRDGYPDLAVSGRDADLNPAALLFLNEAGSALVDSGLSLPQVQTGLAWGDYDQDGDVDLATSSGLLLRNDDGTNFVDTGFALLGGDTSKSVSWADIDNDGLLDLEINGKINQNLGGSFTNDALNPITVGSFGDVPPIWHDFDGDGLLDAAAEGSIYRNTGYVYQPGFHNPEHPEWDTPAQWRFWFQAGGIVFSNWSSPRISLGDYDNDGDSDLALFGAVGSSADVRCSVFRQETNQAFTDIGLLLTGFYSGQTGWQDWDADGDLDLLAAGMDSSFAPQLEGLNNRFADWGCPNTQPEAPQRFQLVQTGPNVLLQWHPAEDEETPAVRLDYEVRVGTYPGSVDVVSPCDSGPVPGNARLIGALSFPTNPTPGQTFYNTNGLPGLRLRNLAAGRYYWNVRTVDGGRSRSPWSAAQSFTMTASGLRLGDINGDGQVDVADLVRCRKMIAGSVPPVVAMADLNDDGEVSEADAVVLLNLLLEVEADGYVPVAEATIGAAGGTLSNGEFVLTVPAGAFTESTDLQLLMAADDRGFGANSPPLMWRIKGLPSTLSGTLTLSGPDLRASPTSEVLMALSQWVRPHGVNDDTLEPVRTFSSVTGTASGGYLTTVLPADLLYGAGSSDGGAFVASKTKAASPTSWEFGIDLGWFYDSYSLKTPHFKIRWDGLTPSYVISLGQELETAFTYFSSNYPFTTKRNWTTYPVQVWLKKLSDEGGEVHSSDNGAYIELNRASMKNQDKRRTTVYHELFHLVQGLVNPSYSITEARDKNLLLVNEATSTWMERFGIAAPIDYAPPNYIQNQLLVFKGLSYGAKTAAAKTGYAMSAMISYLTDQYGESFVPNIYTRIAAGEGAVEAVLNSVPPAAGLTWHADFYRSLVEGSVYDASPLLNISPTMSPLWPTVANTFTATSNQTAQASFSMNLSGLGADGFRFAFTPDVVTAMTNTTALVFSLQNPRTDLELNVVSVRNRPDPRGTITAESYGATPEVIRYRVNDLKSKLPLPANPGIESLRSFVSVVTRTDTSEMDTLRPSELEMAVVDQLDGTFVLPTFSHGQLMWNSENVEFPLFSCSADLRLEDLTGLYSASTSQSSPGVNQGHFNLQLYQDGAILVPLNFSALQSGAPYKDVYAPGSTTSHTRFTFKAMRGYEISKRISGATAALEDHPYVFEPRPFSGSEILVLNEDEEHVYYIISIRFDIEVQDYDSGFPTGTILFINNSMTTPLTVHLERE
jgi:Dockerin type I domain/FG-GAP-like repeat